MILLLFPPLLFPLSSLPEYFGNGFVLGSLSVDATLIYGIAGFKLNGLLCPCPRTLFKRHILIT